MVCVVCLVCVCLTQVEEEQAEWVAGPYDDDVDHDEEGAYGVEAMCRLVAALHAKATMPTALELVTKVQYVHTTYSIQYAHLSCRRYVGTYVNNQYTGNVGSSLSH